MRITHLAALLLACLSGHTALTSAQGVTPTPAPQPVAVDVAYAEANPRLQTLDVYTPADADGPVPTVLLIHGGGFRVGDKREMQPIAEYFVQSGFAVVNINYRLTPAAQYPDPLADSACALAWLHTHAEDYGFDPNHVVAVGESAGGYLVAMLGIAPLEPLLGDCVYSLPENPLRAVIPYYPMTGIAIDDYSSFSRPFFDLLLGAQPEDDDYAERYAAASPLTYIDGSEPPFLIINGTRDPLLPLGDADGLAEALREADVPVQFEWVDANEHAFIARLRTEAGQQAAELARDFIWSVDTEAAN